MGKLPAAALPVPGGVLLESPLRLLEQRNREAFDGRSSSERSPERGSAKTVASRAMDRLPCPCQEGQKGNPGLDVNAWVPAAAASSTS